MPKRFQLLLLIVIKKKEKKKFMGQISAIGGLKHKEDKLYL